MEVSRTTLEASLDAIFHGHALDPNKGALVRDIPCEDCRVAATELDRILSEDAAATRGGVHPTSLNSDADQRLAEGTTIIVVDFLSELDLARQFQVIERSRLRGGTLTVLRTADTFEDAQEIQERLMVDTGVTDHRFGIFDSRNNRWQDRPWLNHP